MKTLSEIEYEQALNRIGKLLDAESREEVAELVRLSDEVEAYEEINYPIPHPDSSDR